MPLYFVTQIVGALAIGHCCNRLLGLFATLPSLCGVYVSGTSLLSVTTGCSRLILYSSYPSLTICDFSKEHHFFSWRRVLGIKINCGHSYCCVFVILDVRS